MIKQLKIKIQKFEYTFSANLKDFNGFIIGQVKYC